MRGRIFKLAALAGAVAATASAASANDDVIRLAADPANVVMPSITYDGWNYSRLDQITADNVAGLEFAWALNFSNDDDVLAAPPIVIDGRMYVIGPKPNIVYAIDLTDDGSLLWSFH